ncbi:hypothetical protein J4Q44_G00005110, partial [Coregonus suidteri]
GGGAKTDSREGRKAEEKRGEEIEGEKERVLPFKTPHSGLWNKGRLDERRTSEEKEREREKDLS